MASSSMGENNRDDKVKVDSSTLNQLMYSIGRLKFTLRSLGNVNVQLSVLPPEENKNEPLVEDVHPLESNLILEKIVSETLAHQSSQADKDQSRRASSIEDLEFINEKLSTELQKIRLKYKDTLTKKSTKSVIVS